MLSACPGLDGPTPELPLWPAGRGPRLGLVGPGRRRQGLGPFLARAFASTGARLTAVAGRDPARSAAAAAALAAELGGPVAVAADAAALARTVDVLVVASPAEHHLEALAAALAAGVPCLCEKPLVAPEQRRAGAALVAEFARRGLLLAENCQWPLVLPALFALHPELRAEPLRRLAMGLSPAGTGRSMVADSLSHVLSVLQALLPLPGAAALAGIRQRTADPAATANEVAFAVAGPDGPVAVELHLRQCPDQPRPAWLEVNGRRIDRRIGSGYRLSFVAGDREQAVADPLHELVYRFAALLGAQDLDRRHALASAIAARLDCYAAILAALGPA